MQDCLSLKPPSVLLALSVLHQYVVRVGGHSLDRKEARDLQEINAKLMEAVAATQAIPRMIEAGDYAEALAARGDSFTAMMRVFDSKGMKARPERPTLPSRRSSR